MKVKLLLKQLELLGNKFWFFFKEKKYHYILFFENLMNLHNISWSYSRSTFSLQFSPGSAQHISFPSIVVRCGPDAPILTEMLLAVHGSWGRQSHFSLGGSWHWKVVHVPVDDPTPAVAAYKRPRHLKIPVWRWMLLILHS